MPCYRLEDDPQPLWRTYMDMGDEEHEEWGRKMRDGELDADYLRVAAKFGLPAEDVPSKRVTAGGTFFACGLPSSTVVCATCERRLSDALCDYPVGNGKTCDLALCRRCAFPVPGADDLDFCRVHHAMYRATAGDEPVIGGGLRLVPTETP